MIRVEPNYREIADAIEEIDEQIKALQDAKKDIYGKVRDDHGKKLADQVKLAVKLNAMDSEKRMERDEIEDGAFRILSILQQPRAPRATRTREIIEEFRPSDGGAEITMRHHEIATDFPPHDADGVVIENSSDPQLPSSSPAADTAGAVPAIPTAPATLSSPALSAGEGGHPSIPSSDALAAGPGLEPVINAKSGQAAAPIQTLSKADQVRLLRPHCQHPGTDLCGGSGRNHCHACKKAMAEGEAA